MPIDESIMVQYLRRSYQAVDGLWFMKLEEATHFEEALEMDRRVWEVLAKIQAREARRLLQQPGNSVEELARCLQLKFAADGHGFEVEQTAEGLRVVIQECPWAKLLRNSGREELGARIAREICTAEGRVWCMEFGGQYRFEMPEMACGGADHCEMRFLKK